MCWCYLASACHDHCYYLRIHTMANPIIAGTADVIDVEDSSSSDAGSVDPDKSIILSTSDVIVTVGSPCPPAAAATKPRFGTQLRGLPHAHVLLRAATICSPAVAASQPRSAAPASDGIVIAVSPCPAAAAASQPRSGTHPFIPSLRYRCSPQQRLPRGSLLTFCFHQELQR